MAILASAIHDSTDQVAAYDTPGGIRVVVKRITGAPGVADTEESYAVFIQRGDNPPHDRFDVDNLLLTQERLRALDIPGFAPDSDNWRSLP